MISSAPASSIRSITGANSPATRVPASSAATAPSFSRRSRSCSRVLRVRGLHERGVGQRLLEHRADRPLRRRRSRAARRARRPKPFAAQYSGGITISDASASFQDSRNSAPAKNSSRATACTASASALSSSVSIACRSPVSRCSTSPWRRLSSASGSSRCRCRKTFARSASVKRSPTQVEAYSSPKESARAEQGEAGHRGGQHDQRGEVGGDEHVVDDELEEPDLRRLDGGEQRREHEAGGPGLAVRPRERPEAPDDRPDAHGRRRGDQPVVVGGRGEGGGEAVEKAHVKTSGAGTWVPAPWWLLG